MKYEKLPGNKQLKRLETIHIYKPFPKHNYRADCFSMLGVARDLAVVNGLPFQSPVVEAQASAIDATINVTRTAEAACPRYVSRVIKGIDVTAPSPVWMQERLRRAGLRSIDAVVDVTNYVLLELGQPMHAFDQDKLNGSINVRMAEQGEKIALLNDQEVELNSDTLVIADDNAATVYVSLPG